MSGMATAAHADSEVTRARSRPEVSRRRGVSVVRAALGVLAVHVVDDNYVQPAAGSSAGDHVVSGLVPVLVLAIVAAFYPYLRAGLRAATAMSSGAIGIAMGTSVAYAVWAGSATGGSATGLLALVAGLVLLVSGPVTLWKARRTTGSRARRHLRRSLNVVAGLLFGVVALWAVVFPVGFSYVYTHTGRAETTPDLGVAIESVTVTTADSLDLRA